MFKKFERPLPVTVQGMVTRVQEHLVKQTGAKIFYNTLGVQGVKGEDDNHYISVSTDEPLIKGSVIEVTGSYSKKKYTEPLTKEVSYNERIYANKEDIKVIELPSGKA